MCSLARWILETENYSHNYDRCHKTHDAFGRVFVTGLLFSPFKVLIAPLHTSKRLFYIEIYPVDEWSLVNNQLVQVSIYRSKLVDRLNKLMDSHRSLVFLIHLFLRGKNLEVSASHFLSILSI